MNLAPVADVLTNKNNTEIGDRSFGTDSKKVADIITTLVKNMQKQQISATFKAFSRKWTDWRRHTPRKHRDRSDDQYIKRYRF